MCPPPPPHLLQAAGGGGELDIPFIKFYFLPQFFHKEIEITTICFFLSELSKSGIFLRIELKKAKLPTPHSLAGRRLLSPMPRIIA